MAYSDGVVLWSANSAEERIEQEILVFFLTEAAGEGLMRLRFGIAPASGTHQKRQILGASFPCRVGHIITDMVSGDTVAMNDGCYLSDEAALVSDGSRMDPVSGPEAIFACLLKDFFCFGVCRAHVAFPFFDLFRSEAMTITLFRQAWISAVSVSRRIFASSSDTAVQDGRILWVFDIKRFQLLECPLSEETASTSVQGGCGFCGVGGAVPPGVNEKQFESNSSYGSVGRSVPGGSIRTDGAGSA
jgi:hypothetical protein